MANKSASEDWKRTLDAGLMLKSNSLITFVDWESNRKTDDNWKVLVTRKRPELTKKISNDTLFYDKLLSLNVFNKRAVETFKVNQTVHFFME